MSYKTIILIFIFLYLTPFAIFAQDDKKLVQFSGLVVGGDSLYGIPGVTIFNPATGRGVFTNYAGFFSMAAMEKDSIVIRSIGYKDKHFIIPDTTDKISIIIELGMDTINLPEIVLWPYATYYSFKQAFLALDVEDKKEDYLAKNLDERLMQRMMRNTDASANMNHRYFTQNQARAQTQNYFMHTTALLNPFAWAGFLKHIKEGGLRNKQWEEIDREAKEEKNRR